MKRILNNVIASAALKVDLALVMIALGTPIKHDIYATSPSKYLLINLLWARFWAEKILQRGIFTATLEFIF
jgi:hypothetical protein